MTPGEPLLSVAAVRSHFEPAGDWAKECGTRVRKLREAMEWSLGDLARLAGTNVQTIYKIERGLIVPREYLKAAIAFALQSEVADIWRPLSRRMLAKVGAA